MFYFFISLITKCLWHILLKLCNQRVLLALWLPTVLGARVHYNPVSCSFWCQLKGPFYTSFLINQHRDCISFQSMPCNSIPDDFLPIYHDRIHQGFHFKALDIGCNLQHFLLGHRPFLGLHEEAIRYKVM